jgi:hypothetical protein
MSLENRIKILADSLGADYCGIADLTGAQEFTAEQGGTMVAGYPREGVIGIRLLNTHGDLLPTGSMSEQEIIN